MHEGHRQRMLKRLAQAEASLEDHELLEILLFNAIPRKNTNDIAHRLLLAFGNLEGVLRADFDRLSSIEGVGESTAAYLRCIALFYERAKRTAVREEIDAFNFDSLSRFLMERFLRQTTEVIELYALDNGGKILESARFCSKSTTEAVAPPEKVSRFIAETQPQALIAAHNHIYGDSKPSLADDRFTRQLLLVCAFHNIRFYDHVIISKQDMFSYRVHGDLSSMEDGILIKMGRILGEA